MSNPRTREMRGTEYQKVLEEIIFANPNASDVEIARISQETHQELKLKSTETIRRNVNKIRINEGFKQKQRVRKFKDTVITDNKKVGSVDYKEFAQNLIERQKLHNKASFSQDYAEIDFKTKHDRIILLNLADLHIGSIGTDYQLLLDFTQLIKENDNIFVALYGDMIDNFVNFRNVLAMHQQVLNPDQQSDFFESWIEDIKDKVLFSTWGNHEEFSERVEGRNIIKRILKKNAIYFNGIGSALLRINNIDYKLAFTHKTRF